MASLEDEQDVVAAKKATAEAKADVAEFDDRSMPHVSLLSGGNEVQDDKYIELIEQVIVFFISFTSYPFSAETNRTVCCQLLGS